MVRKAVVIPAGAAGLYYIHVEGATCHSGGYELTLNLNETVMFFVNHNIVNNKNAQVRERAIIAHLRSGDRLTVNMPKAGCLYGGMSKMTAFYGFRLA